ncbi:MAG: ABC transporter ATP-binding protein [Cyclobacteriaceae bacterium]
MKTYLRVLGFVQSPGLLVPLYFIYTILHVIFSIVNLVTLIPILRLLFGVRTQENVTTLPPFEISLKYVTQTFHYHFGTMIENEGTTKSLYVICSVLVVSALLGNLFGYLASIIQAKAGISLVNNLRKSVIDQISLFDLRYFTQTKRGDILARVMADVQQVETTVISTLKVVLKEPMMILGLFMTLFSMSAELTLYTLLLLPVSGVSIGFIAKRLRRDSKKSQASIANVTGGLHEMLDGIRIVKAFSVRQYVLDKINTEIDHYSKTALRISEKFNLASPISQILGVSFMCIVLIVGGGMVLDDSSNLSPEAFIVFLIIFSQVFVPAKSFANAFGHIQKGVVSADRVFQLMDENQQIVDKPDAVEIMGLHKSISFKNVSFNYDGQSVLSDVSFSISKGKTVALVGPSGGGKSTIADLIPRFYEVEDGNVSIDGTDIKEIKIDSLRSLIGMVTQDSILFNDTVRRNIAFGRPDATLDEIVKAAQVAHADVFIDQMEEGYETIIGERGTKLSGGQRQRLTIARAILKNPEILILDEATSALDAESEKLIQDAIYQATQHRTTLIIAHRLSTIQHADEILVIDKGKIAQRGTHKELMAKSGTYQNMINIQSV